jgi:hypothetical protein
MFAIEVNHPFKGWLRLKGRYSTKECAKGWLPFVRSAWNGCHLRIVECKEPYLTANS